MIPQNKLINPLQGPNFDGGVANLPVIEFWWKGCWTKNRFSGWSRYADSYDKTANSGFWFINGDP